MRLIKTILKWIDEEIAFNKIDLDLEAGDLD